MRARRLTVIRAACVVAATALTALANATAAPPPVLVVQSGHTGSVHSAAFSPDGKAIVTASADKTAIVWNAESGEKLRTLAGHTNHVHSAAFSRDAKAIVTASADNTAIVWNAESGEKLRTLAGHTSSVYSAAFSPDGKAIVTASVDNTAIVWNAESGEKLRTLAGHTSYVLSAAFNPDGKAIVTASGDKTAIVWNAESGKKIRTLAGHTSSVSSAAFSPDGKAIVTASWDNTAIVWNAESGEKLRTFAGHTSSVDSAAFSPNGKAIVTASMDKTVIVWNAESGEKLRTLAGHTYSVSSAAFSPDGKAIVTASYDNTAIVWNAESGEKLRTLAGHTSSVYSAAFSPDGKAIVTASYDKTAIVWNAESGEEIRTLAGHTNRVDSAAFSPDGKAIVTASWDKTAIVWDAISGKKIRSLAGHTNSVNAAAFSPDGKAIVTASDDKTAIVWNAESGEKLRTLAGHTNWVSSAAFSPDGKAIVTASDDKTAIVWNAESGEKLRTLAGHTTYVSSAAFSPDGKAIVTASGDGTTRLWNTATGRELCSLISFDTGREWLVVTPEGYYQGSLAAEKFVRWRIDGENGPWPRLVGPEQMRDTFYRPDLFRYLLTEGNVVRALARADAERGKSTKPTTVADEQPPVVLVVAPDDHAKVTEQFLHVKAIAKGAGVHPVESLQLILNNQSEGRIQRVQEPKLGQIAAEWPSVRLRPGKNSILVIAKAGGTTGESSPIEVTYLSRDQITVRLHILVIGVDKYMLAPDAGGYKSLRHAASGAKKVGEAFARHGRALYNEVLPPKVLLNQDATKDNVLDALDEFSGEMAKDDVGVIFYAGHGDKSNDLLYLTTHDSNKKRLLRTSVSATQFRDVLTKTKGRIYLFLDACYSGAITQRSGNTDSIHEDLIRELRREVTGTVIATACRGDEQTNENEVLGGFFTCALVEGLSGKARLRNGAVYARDLEDYVGERLKELTQPLGAKYQQRPYFDGSKELMELPLVKP